MNVHPVYPVNRPTKSHRRAHLNQLFLLPLILPLPPRAVIAGFKRTFVCLFSFKSIYHVGIVHGEADFENGENGSAVTLVKRSLHHAHTIMRLLK